MWAGRLTTKPSASAVNRLARTRKPRNPICGRLSELVLISFCFMSISGVVTLNLFLRQVRRFYSFLVLIIKEKISRCSYVRFLHVWHWRLVVDQGKISLSNCQGQPVSQNSNSKLTKSRLLLCLGITFQSPTRAKQSYILSTQA